MFFLHLQNGQHSFYNFYPNQRYLKLATLKLLVIFFFTIIAIESNKMEKIDEKSSGTSGYLLFQQIWILFTFIPVAFIFFSFLIVLYYLSQTKKMLDTDHQLSQETQRKQQLDDKKG